MLLSFDPGAISVPSILCTILHTSVCNQMDKRDRMCSVSPHTGCGVRLLGLWSPAATVCSDPTSSVGNFLQTVYFWSWRVNTLRYFLLEQPLFTHFEQTRSKEAVSRCSAGNLKASASPRWWYQTDVETPLTLDETVGSCSGDEGILGLLATHLVLPRGSEMFRNSLKRAWRRGTIPESGHIHLRLITGMWHCTQFEPKTGMWRGLGGREGGATMI